jgi:hypothetical protein
MTGTGMLAMFALCLVGITVYSFLIFLPCWIIAKRRNVAGSWWNWVIPLWNSYIAFRLGNGSIKQATVVALLLVAGAIGFVLKDISQIVMVAGGLLLGSAVVMFFYISYNWLMQIGILAGVHKHLLPMVLLVLQVTVVVGLVAYSILDLGTTEYVGVIDNTVNLLSWIFFLIVAVRTPRAENPPQALL